MGSPYYSGDHHAQGRTYLFFGNANGYQIEPQTKDADVIFTGENDNDSSGYSVAGLGDVNGDGYGDLLIAAPNEFSNGKTYLIFGHAGSWKKDVSLSTADVIFNGTIHDVWQINVAGVGDVNGDGLKDFLIGYPYMNRGASYLFFGRTNGWNKTTSVGKADVQFIGETYGDGSGGAVAGVGDVNKDGFDDFMMGAPNNNEIGTSSGKAYLILGRNQGWSKSMSLSKADASFRGTKAYEMAGSSLSGGGDINGDGMDDILIGSNNYNPFGRVNIIYGKQNGWARNVSLSQSDRFIGNSEGIIESAIIAGDMDGDGHADVLVLTTVSSIRLYLGTTIMKKTDLNTTDSDAYMYGISASTIGSLAGGDVNNDGYDDILIGQPLLSTSSWYSGEVYLLYADLGTGPAPIKNIVSYDKTFATPHPCVVENMTVGVELDGKDSNSTRNDISVVRITSDEDIGGIELRLFETDKSTGIFRGTFQIKDRSDLNHGWLKAEQGSRIKVQSVVDPTKVLNISVGPLVMYPNSDHGIAKEDSQYLVQYSTNIKNGSTVWALNTNAKWLKFNSSNETLYGIPDNADVGNWNVGLNVTEDCGCTVKHVFNITVRNTSPKITTHDITSTWEDSLYKVDYNSTDDGQGIITWHLITNATWLGMNSSTGELSGVPHEKDVGSYQVQVSVDDGNGGWDNRTFILTVINVNHPPKILGEDRTAINKYSEYTSDYTVVDPDQNDKVFIWDLQTNATWLKLNYSTGRLFGTPNGYDVGYYWVRLSVMDQEGAMDWRNFTITVLDVNAPPIIDTTDVVNATEDSIYSVQYSVKDPNLDDILTWHLQTNASKWLSIDSNSGFLLGRPGNDDVGSYWVNVSVIDQEKASDFHNFTLTVINVNDVPVIKSSPVTSAMVSILYRYHVDAVDIDKGDILTYTLITKPNGMVIDPNTGFISWTPTEIQLGKQHVIISVSDGKATINQTFDILVVKFNHPPVIAPSKSAFIKVGTTYKYKVRASDQDAGDVLIYSLAGEPQGMSITNQGLIKWTPIKGQIGEYNITVWVSDGINKTSSQFKIIVEPASQNSQNNMGLMIPLSVGIFVAIGITAVGMMMIRRKKKI